MLVGEALGCGVGLPRARGMSRRLYPEKTRPISIAQCFFDHRSSSVFSPRASMRQRITFCDSSRCIGSVQALGAHRRSFSKKFRFWVPVPLHGSSYLCAALCPPGAAPPPVRALGVKDSN